MRLLSDDELKSVPPAETAAFSSPIPTQSVSSDEFMPAPQTQKQRRVEARIKEMGSALARKQGLSRRQFLTSASGMAVAFLAMNEVYGPLYGVSPAEATDRQMAEERHLRRDQRAALQVREAHRARLRSPRRHEEELRRGRGRPE